MATTSIQRRLVAVIAISQLLLAVGLIDVAVFVTRAQLLRAFDVALQGRAMSIAALVRYSEDSPHKLVFEGDLVPPPLEKGFPEVYEVYADPHILIARSPNWPEKDAVLPPRGYRWIASYAINGVPYRKLRLEHVPVLDRESDISTADYLTVTYAAPIEPVLRAVSDVLLYIVIGSLALLGVSVAFSFWALRRSLRPLSALADSARAISPRNWKLDPPEEACETYELEPLTQAMTSMLTDLHRAFTQQREFLANTAHELKTPVAILKSTLQSLLQRPRSAEEYRTGVEEALDDMARLEKLLHSMLRLARAEQWAAGSLQRDLPPVDIGMTCQLAVERLRPLADQRQIGIDFVSNGTVRIPADPDDLELVWANLLENAIRFSPAAEMVCIGIHAEQQHCYVEVTDRGPGIPSTQLPHIFERFHRGDSSRARNTGGYGLGLAISKALVEAYGGTIEAQSGDGAGTRMVVRLPAVR
jgi:signal transduction histidine kinase